MQFLGGLLSSMLLQDLPCPPTHGEVLGKGLGQASGPFSVSVLPHWEPRGEYSQLQGPLLGLKGKLAEPC